MTKEPATIKKETDFNIGRQFCPHCQKWRFFYRLKSSDGDWFCQVCNTTVNSVE